MPGAITEHFMSMREAVRNEKCLQSLLVGSSFKAFFLGHLTCLLQCDEMNEFLFCLQTDANRHLSHLFVLMSLNAFMLPDHRCLS